VPYGIVDGVIVAPDGSIVVSGDGSNTVRRFCR
jgi:hypothetical protein